MAVDSKPNSAFGVMLRQDRRHLRAHSLVAAAMDRLEPVLGPEVRRRNIANALFEVFMAEGVEVLTDYTRQELGLPPRGPDGWTAEEVLALEARRLEAMLTPMPHFIAKGG